MLGRVKFKNLRSKSEDEDTDPSLLKKSVTIKEDRKVTTDYKIGEYLGSGKFGEVKRCEEKKTGGQFAAKFVPIASQEDMDSVRNEIAIMNRLRHPRLIQLYDAYSCKSEVVMVLELITGGELFERIIDESFDLNESRCIRFMNEILQGVDYIHTQGVLHLDLKPENILCLSKTSFKIKIIDFGLARFYSDGELCVLFGTPEFVAPEVISYDPVSPAADMWSIGVICYVMLSGLSPFLGDSQGETLANIMKVTYNFDYPEFDEISEEARDFIRKLLVKDSRKRLTAADCLQHPWIARKKQLKRKGTVSKKRLKHFVYRRKWQKAVNAIIALLRMGVVLHHVPSDKESAASSTLKPSIPTEKRAPKQDKGSASTSAEQRERKSSGIFSRLSSKRMRDADTESPTQMKLQASRRPSLLSRLGKKGSKEEQNSLKNHKPQEDKRIRHQDVIEGDVPRKKGNDSTDASSQKQSVSRTFKSKDANIPVDQKELEGKNCATNMTGGNLLTSFKQDKKKDSKSLMLQKGVQPRKIAPTAGGIASKISFFSNLQDNTKNK